MLNAPTVAAALCLVPTGALLLFLGRRYEGYFDDRRLVFSLVVGLFAGLVVFFLEWVVFGFHHVPAEGKGEPYVLQPLGPVWLLLGYGLVESLAKLVVLGSKGYRSRKDTPFYGASLGAGFGATLALQYLAHFLTDRGVLGMGWSLDALRTALAPTLLAFGIVVLSAAVGARLGKSVTDGKLRSAPFRAMLWQAPAPALLGLLGLAYRYDTPGWQVVLVGALCLAYALAVWAFSVRMLDGIVPPEIRDMVRRDMRRRRRKGARDGDAQDPAGGP